MAGTIDFGIVKPELATSFGTGYRESQQNRQAQELNQLRIDTAKSDFQRLQQERQQMLDFQGKLKSMGQDTNLDTYFDHMISSGIPDYVEKGMAGKQKLNEQRQFARIMGFDDPTAVAPRAAPGGMTPGAAPAMPVAQPNALAPATPAGAAAPAQPPANAMVAPSAPAAPMAPAAPAAGAPAAPGAPRPNAVASQFGPEQVATITDRIQRLTALGTPQAIQTAKILQDQLEMVARQKAEGGAKLSDRFVPVGKNVFDRQTQQWIKGPVSGPDTVVQMGGGAGVPPTKLKPGEVYNAELDRVEAKPGTELYVKQSKEHAKDYKAANGTLTKMDDSIAKIDKILAPSNKSAFEGNFGGYNAYGIRMLPGENSDMRKTIDSFKSDLKQAGLELMRQGGSIGQMTEREWPIVEQMIASIDPVLGEAEARNVFEQVKARFQRIKEAAQDVYDTQWGQTQYHKGLGAGGRNPPPPAGGNLSPEDKQALDWANANPKDPRAAAIKQRLGAK